MARHNKVGVHGEELARNYFVETGYAILYVNWRHSHYEIDIIAQKGEILHFIEVKARTSTKFGYPEEAITKKKMQNLVKAGEEFLFQNPGWKKIQYDVLSIQILKNNNPEFFLFEDVYLHEE
jgi:putative endonuclease